MGLPANIRMNVLANFPSLVSSTGPIAIVKSNGVWIVSLVAGLLGVQIPPLGNFATDQVLVYDSVAKTWIMVPMSAFAVAALGPVQRKINVIGDLPISAATDQQLNFNAASDLAPVLPLALARSGAPLTFKSIPGSHSQTITRNSTDLIDGQTTVLLGSGASLTLFPYNDGVNSGWGIK